MMTFCYGYGWLLVSRATTYIRGYELPEFIVTFDGLTLPYGELGL